MNYEVENEIRSILKLKTNPRGEVKNESPFEMLKTKKYEVSGITCSTPVFKKARCVKSVKCCLLTTTL